jgi:anti-sigma B factor antagonist
MRDDDDDFRVERRLDGDVAVVEAEGDIDLRTADAVRAEIGAAVQEARRVVIDLREVTFMDSSGIRLIVEAQLSSERDGFAFAVVRGPAPVQRLFELAGLEGRVRVIDDPFDLAGDEQPDER